VLGFTPPAQVRACRVKRHDHHRVLELPAANPRDRVTLGDVCYWVYGYDRLGQVTSGKHD
jgi:hypothetical protein